jgi:predicted TIM-barrel fold metal-dependent hydrolase
MNFNSPQTAIDLAIQFPNVCVDTSWQPAEVIGEAVHRAGARKVLFGTDWPLAGANVAVGRERIGACVSAGFFSEEEAALVLGDNAERILAPQTTDVSHAG